MCFGDVGIDEMVGSADCIPDCCSGEPLNSQQASLQDLLIRFVYLSAYQHGVVRSMTNPSESSDHAATYGTLDSERVIETIKKLQDRIKERFPNSGLGRVCGELLEIAKKSKERIAWMERPHYGLRVATLIIIGLILMILIQGIISMSVPVERYQFSEFIQVLEAGLNVLILIGGTIFFFATLEIRRKRARALREIHVLRSLAHIVDMHQLTKDPERFFKRKVLTPSSPQLNLTPFQLNRYLDYCSEMLALIGKLAALYAQNMEDPVVLDSVTRIESLTASLAHKIWQKIMILDQFIERE